MNAFRASRTLLGAVLMVCGLGLGACGSAESEATEAESGAELNGSVEAASTRATCDLNTSCIRPESGIICNNGYGLMGVRVTGGYCYRRDGCGDGTPICP